MNLPFKTIVFIVTKYILVIYLCSMEMIRKAKRKLNSTKRLRILCYFCVIVMGLAILEIAFEVLYVRRGLGDNKVKMYVYSIASRHMPIHYWRDRQKFPGNYKESKTPPICSSIPHPGDIMFATPYWQRLVGDSFSAYLYTAYWEQKPHPTVSIILLSTGLPDNLYCKLWFLNEAGPLQVRAETRLLIDSKTESNVGTEVQTAYTVLCKLERRHVIKPPIAVSLVKQPQCKKIDNVLTVINLPLKYPGDLSMGFYKPPPLLPYINDISIGVCVIWPDEEDDNTDLVAHWFEILRMVGVHRIYISINKAHNRVHNLIHFYEEHGLVLKLAKSRPLSANSLLALTPELRVRYDITFQTLIYTDCLYQARDLHDYVLMLRPFEVVMPCKDDDVWQHLIKENREDNLADALVVDRWNEAGDESKENQNMEEDRPYRSFQRTNSVTVAKLWGPETCSNKEGNPRKCKQRNIKKGAKFLPYIAVKECTHVRKIPNGIQTECVYHPHEMLITLWYFVDSVANAAISSLY